MIASLKKKHSSGYSSNSPPPIFFQKWNRLTGSSTTTLKSREKNTVLGFVSHTTTSNERSLNKFESKTTLRLLQQPRLPPK